MPLYWSDQGDNTDTPKLSTPALYIPATQLVIVPATSYDLGRKARRPADTFVARDRRGKKLRGREQTGVRSTLAARYVQDKLPAMQGCLWLRCSSCLHSIVACARVVSLCLGRTKRSQLRRSAVFPYPSGDDASSPRYMRCRDSLSAVTGRNVACTLTALVLTLSSSMTKPQHS